MDPTLLNVLFNAPKAANSVACFLGLAESIDKKAQKLCSTPYNSALRFLRDAQSSETQQEHLLREAQRSFTDAITLETGSRLATAYLGLALCQIRLGDSRNAMLTLNELTAQTFGGNRAAVGAAKVAFRLIFPELCILFGMHKHVDGLLDRMSRLSDTEAATELQMMAKSYVQHTEKGS